MAPMILLIKKTPKKYGTYGSMVKKLKKPTKVKYGPMVL